MKRYTTIILAAAIYATISCDRMEPVPVSGGARPAEAVTLDIVSTKTSLNLDFKVVWDKGDEVLVLSRAEPSGRKYFTEKSNTSKGIFNPVGDGEPVVDFPRYVVYPVSAVPENAAMEDARLTISFEALGQQACNMSLNRFCDISSLPMAGSSETNDFFMKNLCGAVKFSLEDISAGVVVKGFEVRANGGEQIAGKAVVDLETAEVTLATGGDRNVIRVFCEDGTRTTAAAGSFGFVVFLPAGTYSRGLSYSLILEDDSRIEFGSERQITVYPGIVTPLAMRKAVFYYGNSNCHIASPSQGSLSFDITPYYVLDEAMGWTGTPHTGSVIKEAEILWQQGGEIIGSPTVDGNTLSMDITGVPGNALVAIRDASDMIVWSYHVWVTEFSDVEYSGTMFGGNFSMMDRNLGAISVDETKSPNITGLYYQWGRKDPFPGNLSSGRSTGKTPVGDAHKSVDFSWDMPLGYSVSHPDERIKSADTWIDVSDYNRFWGNPAGTLESGKGIRTVFDPCPEGYRVPDRMAYYAVCEHATLKNGAVTTTMPADLRTEIVNNYAIVIQTGVDGVTGLWPAGGIVCENEDSQQYLLSRCYMWSNLVVANGKARNFYFNQSNISCNPENAIAMATPLRCMKVNQ